MLVRWLLKFQVSYLRLKQKERERKEINRKTKKERERDKEWEKERQRKGEKKTKKGREKEKRKKGSVYCKVSIHLGRPGRYSSLHWPGMLGTAHVLAEFLQSSLVSHAQDIQYNNPLSDRPSLRFREREGLMLVKDKFIFMVA